VPKTLSKIGKFFREVRAELGKVIWPDRKQTMVYTAIVVASVFVIAGIIWVADVVLGQVIGIILR
jgi:preprotein translocase subunit SecE